MNRPSLSTITGIATLVLLAILLALEITSRVMPSQNGNPLLLTSAEDMYAKGLYQEAARDYTRYLETSSRNGEHRGNVHYTLAKLAFEQLKDYEKAYAHFEKAKRYLDEDAPAYKKANSYVIECLELLGRSAQAESLLEQNVLLTNEITDENPLIARIGDERVTLSELNRELDALPPAYRAKITGKEEKIAMLRQILLRKALYRKGKRLQYLSDKDVMRELRNMEESYIAQKVMENELKGRVNVTQAEVELYYEKNKSAFKKNGTVPPLADVTDEVKQKVMQEKLLSEQNEVARELFESEEIKIYRDAIR